MKKCCICQKIKSFNEFHKNKQQKDGHECRCKRCRHKISVANYNPEKQKFHYLKNRDKILKIQKKYNDKHKIERQIYTKKRYMYLKSINSEYNKEHYLKYKNYYKAKRARIEQGLCWYKKYPNPFDESEEIEWHHINNTEIVSVPKFIHRLYCCNNREEHREKMNCVVKQIYGDEKIE